MRVLRKVLAFGVRALHVAKKVFENRILVVAVFVVGFIGKITAKKRQQKVADFSRSSIDAVAAKGDFFLRRVSALCRVECCISNSSVLCRKSSLTSCNPRRFYERQDKASQSVS